MTLKVPFVLYILMFLTIFTVCKSSEKTAKALTLYGLRGSSGVGLVKLFEEPPKIEGFNVETEVLAQQDLMAARIISGEAKAGILPPNMAAKIYTSGASDIRVAAVIGTGMLSLLSYDPNVKSIEDLKGKTVEVAGQGATPDYVFQKILRFYGLEPGVDVKLAYSLAPPEIAQSLIAGRVLIALLPEPFATMASLGKPDLHRVADIQDEWVKAHHHSEGNYPMTLLVVDGAFASDNPDAVQEILGAVKNSIEWVKSNPAEAGALAEKHELGLRAPVVTAAIPKSNYVFIPAAEARSSLEALFRVFLENDPVSIGGALPKDEFYLK